MTREGIYTIGGEFRVTMSSSEAKSVTWVSAKAVITENHHKIMIKCKTEYWC